MPGMVATFLCVCSTACEQSTGQQHGAHPTAFNGNEDALGFCAGQKRQGIIVAIDGNGGQVTMSFLSLSRCTHMRVCVSTVRDSTVPHKITGLLLLWRPSLGCTPVPDQIGQSTTRQGG